MYRLALHHHVHDPKRNKDDPSFHQRTAPKAGVYHRSGVLTVSPATRKFGISVGDDGSTAPWLTTLQVSICAAIQIAIR
jgi:hypothetical protein